MKKRRFPAFLVGFLILLFGALGAFAWWCHVPVKDPATLAAIEKRVAEMLAARARIPAQDNGFEALRPIWGYKTDQQLDAARQERLRALPTFCYEKEFYSHHLADIRKLLQSDGPGLRAAEKESLVEYPALKAALEKPYFFYPTTLQAREPVPNYIVMRAACQTLSLLGALRAVQGDLDGALEPLLLGIRMGARLSENGGTMANAIGTACAAICLAPLEDIMNEGRLNPEQCRRVRSALQTLPLGRDQFLLAADSELVMSLNSLRRFEIFEPGQAVNPPPVLGPLYAGRERGLLVNLYLEQRPYLEKFELTPPLPDLAKEYPWDHAFDLLMPNSRRLEAWYKLLVLKVEAFQVMAALGAGEPMPQGTGFDYKQVGRDYELSCTAEWLKEANQPSGTIQLHPAPSPSP